MDGESFLRRNAFDAGMRSDARLPDALALPADAARGLSPPLRDLQAQFLFYKSFFVGAWFDTLTSEQEAPHVERVLGEISERALDEALQVIAALQDWERVHADEDRLNTLRERIRARLLGDLLDLKESAGETLVMAAMAAPTAELRDRIVRLADEDRRNGDMIRELLKTKTVSERRFDAPDGAEACGVSTEDAPGELVSARIRHTLDGLRSKGETPVRVVVSGMAVRRLRDEGVVRRPEGTVFDLPVTVDFGWGGSCFAVLTNDGVSLSEIFTAEHTGAGTPSTDD